MIKSIIKLIIQSKSIVLFLAFFLMGNKMCSSQIIDNCNVIKTFLNNKNSNDIFGLSKNTGFPIIFYDKSGLLSECSFSSVYNRRVLVSQDTLDEISISPAHFIIYNIKANGNRIKLAIRYKSSGADGTIEMRKKNKRIKIKKFDIGFF